MATHHLYFMMPDIRKQPFEAFFCLHIAVLFLLGFFFQEPKEKLVIFLFLESQKMPPGFYGLSPPVS